MRRGTIGAIGLGVLVVGVACVQWWRSDAEPTPAARLPAVAAAPAPSGEHAARADTPARPAPPAPPALADASDDDLGGGFERALRWSQVDLEAIRRAIPDNRYWETSAPTKDPALLEARARERARWNEAYGQVLAGHASEAEIHLYFAHRQQVSSDAIEFADTLLERHRDVLPARDVGLLEMTIRMHHKRLQELPRELAEAIERKQSKDALREAWLRDEQRFAVPADQPRIN